MVTDEEQEIRKMWDYSQPEQTRLKFKQFQQETYPNRSDTYHLILVTQIARTHGLQQQFDTGHQLLDSYMDQFEQADPLIKLYYHLERGRLYNSDGKKQEALNQFYRAWDLGKTNQFHFLAVDAAHMIAIAAETQEESFEWNMTAIDYAETEGDDYARKWLGSLYNNQGWNYHDAGEYEQALDLFVRAEQFHADANNARAHRIARWTIGRVYRSLERIDEALEIMHQLQEEAEDNSTNGYVFEELGELYLIKEEDDKAASYFGQAYEILSQDPWLQRNEQDRLERMQQLASQ